MAFKVLQLLMCSYVVVPGDLSSGLNILQYDTPQTQPGPSVVGGSHAKRSSQARDISSNPRLDQFVLDMRSLQELKDASVTSVTEFGDARAINYYMDSRWCQGVGREHSRNRPFFTANLNAHVLYQMCHSTKCRTLNGPFRSTAVQIPRAVVDNLPDFSVDDGLDQLLAVMPLPE